MTYAYPPLAAVNLHRSYTRELRLKCARADADEQTMRHRAATDRGQTSVEYVLILAIVALVTFVAFMTLGDAAGGAIGRVAGLI